MLNVAFQVGDDSARGHPRVAGRPGGRNRGDRILTVERKAARIQLEPKDVVAGTKSHERERAGDRIQRDREGVIVAEASRGNPEAMMLPPAPSSAIRVYAPPANSNHVMT